MEAKSKLKAAPRKSVQKLVHEFFEKELENKRRIYTNKHLLKFA